MLWAWTILSQVTFQQNLTQTDKGYILSCFTYTFTTKLLFIVVTVSRSWLCVIKHLYITVLKSEHRYLYVWTYGYLFSIFLHLPFSSTVEMLRASTLMPWGGFKSCLLFQLSVTLFSLLNLSVSVSSFVKYHRCYNFKAPQGQPLALQTFSKFPMLLNWTALIIHSPCFDDVQFIFCTSP